MYTERMVVRSGWEPKCGVERYESKGVPGSVLDELAAALHVHKYGSASGRKSEEMREIRNELCDAREVGVRKRRSRRPTTSALSDKVWREMRKQITGRAQDDGVT